MAGDEDILDPKASMARALSALTVQVEKANQHLESLKDDSMKGYLAGQKQVQEAGVTSGIPGIENVRTSSQTTGGGVTMRPAGATSPWASQSGGGGGMGGGGGEPSEGPEEDEPFESPEEKRRRELAKRRQEPKSMINRRLGQQAAETRREEELKVPQYRWTLSEKARLTTDLALKTAARTAPTDEEGNIIGPPTSLVGRAAMKVGEVSQGISEKAAVYEKIESGAKNLMKHVYSSGDVGASLGYSPQTGIGGAYIAGIRNPLAAFTSEAGTQGLGQKVGALSAMFGGGISYGQAQDLRNALSERGFSNQGGGVFGAFGENESLAGALEPAVKEGLSPGVAAEFGQTTRFGQFGINELQKTLQGLGRTAQITKLSIDEAGKSLLDYAKEMEAHGQIPGRSLIHGKEIMGMTGMTPQYTSQTNESPLGEAIASASGFFPGTIGAASGSAQVVNRAQTARAALAMARGVPVNRYNKAIGGEEEALNAEEAKIAEAHAINPQIPTNVLKAELEHPHRAERRAELISPISKLAKGEEAAAPTWEKMKRDQEQALKGLGVKGRDLGTEISETGEWATKLGGSILGLWQGGSKKEQEEHERAPAIAQGKHNLDLINKHIAAEHNREKGKAASAWSSAMSWLQNPANESPLSQEEIAEEVARHGKGAKSLEGLTKKLEGKAKLEEEGGEKVEITLNQEARHFFDVIAKKTKTQLPKTEAGQGGTPTGKYATSVSTGKEAGETLPIAPSQLPRGAQGAFAAGQ